MIYLNEDSGCAPTYKYLEMWEDLWIAHRPKIVIDTYMTIIYTTDMMDPVSMPEFEGFEWDQGNIDKNWLTHSVTPQEAEQVFFNAPLIVADDATHSRKEKRFYVLGQSDEDRQLFIAFTLRNKRIRVISARDMSRKERKVYQS